MKATKYTNKEFEYYSVETAYEVDFRDRQKEVFKTYSEAEKTAGDNIILEVDLIVRNDKKAVSEHDKEVFEDETDEIECRCIWYHHNGVKGMIAQDTKRVIKKPETAEVSKEVKEQFEKQKTSFKFYDVSIAYQVERYVNCGSLKYVQLGTYSDYAKAVKAAQEAIESWGEENIYFHTVEFAKRSSEPIKNNKKVFKSETHEIDYYWISARLTDTKECGYVNIDSPIRIPIETSEQSETVEQTEVEETAKTETAETAEQEAMETVEGISKTETTTETDDSGFTYYSVKVAYEAMDDKKRSIVFMNYSEALEVAEHFTETWGGDKAIVIAVNFVIRNDRQPESERDKRVLEDETAEIERRCVPYNYLGLRGYVSIEDKQIVNEDIA